MLDSKVEDEVKLSLAVVGCALAAALAGCDTGADSADKAMNAGSQPEQTVFSGYAKDLQKAKQVEQTLKAAKEGLDARLKKMTQSSPAGGE
ncbi:MAG: hypothetical protein L0H73_09720 [Nitrococcus sp.]|nr:hypothetical protein [Nitrococcus sp.]